LKVIGCAGGKSFILNMMRDIDDEPSWGRYPPSERCKFAGFRLNSKNCISFLSRFLLVVNHEVEKSRLGGKRRTPQSIFGWMSESAMAAFGSCGESTDDSRSFPNS